MSEALKPKMQTATLVHKELFAGGRLGVFKLRPGAAVKVDNATQPANSPAPKPEDS